MKINNNNEIAAAVVTMEGAKDVRMKILIGPADGSKPREVYIDSDAEISYEDPAKDQESRDKWQM